MQSMTGYAQALYQDSRFNVGMEIRSVNHRFREVAVHMPKHLMQYEVMLKQVVASHIHRGRVDVYVQVEMREEAMPQLNWSRLEQWVALMQEISRRHHLSLELTIGDLLKLPELWDPPQVEDWERVLMQLAEEALGRLTQMRLREGEHLQHALLEGIEALKDCHQQFVRHQPAAAQAQGERLRRRLEEYLQGTAVDESRWLQEVAILAERSDVTEELVRLKSHIAQMEALVHQNQPVGRKLDFLLQEMNREVNTIGSKCNHLEMVQIVVESKSIIEKLREQVQNVE